MLWTRTILTNKRSFFFKTINLHMKRKASCSPMFVWLILITISLYSVVSTRFLQNLKTFFFRQFLQNSISTSRENLSLNMGLMSTLASSKKEAWLNQLLFNYIQEKSILLLSSQQCTPLRLQYNKELYTLNQEFIHIPPVLE